MAPAHYGRVSIERDSQACPETALARPRPRRPRRRLLRLPLARFNTVRYVVFRTVAFERDE
jgi:hypothetical protein